MVAPLQSSGTSADAVRAAALDPSTLTPTRSSHATFGQAVQAGAHRVVTALTDGAGPRNRDEWLSVVGDCQGLINVLTAVQDHAAVEVARQRSRCGWRTAPSEKSCTGPAE